MHSRAVVSEDRFGHEGGRQAGGAGSVLDDVLELHHVISCGHQGIEAVVDFLLAARTNLVVGAFKGKSDLGQEVSHFITQVGEVISGGDREVSALDGNLVPEVSTRLAASGIPVGLVRIESVEGVLRTHLVANVVEDEELGFCSDVAGIGNSGRTQVSFGLGSDLARVAREGLIGEWVDDRENNDQCFVCAERINKSRGQIGNQFHVRLVDLREAPN